MLSNILKSLFVVTLLTPLIGAPVGTVSLVNLDKVASEVVVGVLGVPSAGTIEVTVQRAVKGVISPGTVVLMRVPLPLSETVRATADAQRPVIVFLQRTASGWEFVPSSFTQFLPGQGLFYAASPTGPGSGLLTTAQSSSLDRLIAEFGAGLLEKKDLADDYLVFLPGILWEAASPSVDRLGETLASSQVPGHRAGGYIIQILRGKITALAQYRKDKLLTASQVRAVDLAAALNWREANPEAIRVLGELSRESEGKTPFWVLQTLRRLKTRAALPYLATALDSADADVQYQGVAGLAEFANGHWEKRAADARPTLGLPGQPTEFTSSDTLAHFPVMDTFQQNREQYVSFWKAWWQSNRARAGF
jgi:hypothetical protein